MSLDGEVGNAAAEVDPGENMYRNAGAVAGHGETVGWTWYRKPSLLASCAKHMALLDLTERTGYSMLQVNGQRLYGGPPPGWDGPPPPRGCEVFIGNIPRDMYEDELVPLFDRAGHIYEFRLMLEFSGENRGYSFVKFSSRDEAHRAIQLLNNFEVRPGNFISVCLSVDNCRLYISPIPRYKTRDHILEEMKTVTEGVMDVIVPLSSSDEEGRNRGFAFIKYESHKAATLARRRLMTVKPWGQYIQVKWVELETVKEWECPQPVQVLYVCNLQPHTSEETLHQAFSRFSPGSVECVKKISNYGFIHYRHNTDAMMALSLMNGAHIDGASVEVWLARDRNATTMGSNGQVEGAGGGGGGHGSPRRSSPLQTGQRGGGGGAGGGGGRGAGGGGGAGGGRGAGEDRSLVPLLPDTPLSPASLLSLKPSQISSAVSLLEYYCIKKFWSPPEYYLLTTPDPNGGLLIIYMVFIRPTQRTFLPNTLCQRMDDAKELAAKTTLSSLGSTAGHFLSMM